MPRRYRTTEDSVETMIREFRENRGIDVEAEEPTLFIPPPPVYPECHMKRSQAVAALRIALQKDYMSEWEIERMEQFFQNAIDEELQGALGEERLRRLGGPNVIKRTTRRVAVGSA